MSHTHPSKSVVCPSCEEIISHDGALIGCPLHAAAPELVAALRWARGHILRHASLTTKQEGTDETLARIDAAIARAKGE